jgi:hypothetical protein
MKKQNGFSLGIVIAVVAVVIVGGLVAWRTWPTSPPSTTGGGNDQAISSPADAQRELQELDDSSLDADLKPSVLDEDIESLL